MTKPRWETLGVALLAGAAALRVFVFAAAFPFFNNVDEQFHVDLVGKYSRGHWPTRADEHCDAASGRLVGALQTLEYFHRPEEYPGGVFPAPLREKPAEVVEKTLRAYGEHWAKKINFEALAPPVYYAVAGAWYRLGGWLGFGAGPRLYFVRFLNVPLAALLVVLAHRLCTLLDPDRRELRLGVPMLAAFLPQDVFYSVNADVLSPVLFTLALIGLIEWYRREGGALLGVAVGLLVAATLLVKYTNVALAAVFGLTALLKLRRTLTQGRPRDALRAICPALLAALLPFVLYCARNHALYGDWLATRHKVAFLGWTARPGSAYLDHPLFGTRGLWTFWHELMGTFWRGEFVWHLERIAHPFVDGFYSISSALLLAAAVAAALWERPGAEASGAPGNGSNAPSGPFDGPDRLVATAIPWVSVGVSLCCLAYLSVAFEYGRSFYPSRAHPFFTSGRLIFGMLVPFLVLYVRGAAFLARPVGRVKGTLAFLALVCLLMTASEVVLTRPVFGNPQNWFHLP